MAHENTSSRNTKIIYINKFAIHAYCTITNLTVSFGTCILLELLMQDSKEIMAVLKEKNNLADIHCKTAATGFYFKKTKGFLNIYSFETVTSNCRLRAATGVHRCREFIRNLSQPPQPPHTQVIVVALNSALLSVQGEVLLL